MFSRLFESNTPVAVSAVEHGNRYGWQLASSCGLVLPLALVLPYITLFDDTAVLYILQHQHHHIHQHNTNTPNNNHNISHITAT